MSKKIGKKIFSRTLNVGAYFYVHVVLKSPINDATKVLAGFKFPPSKRNARMGELGLGSICREH